MRKGMLVFGFGALFACDLESNPARTDGSIRTGGNPVQTTGGSVTKGGALATGGMQGTGGTPMLGGSSQKGGMASSGGIVGTGGVSSSGGNAGGKLATGGTVTTGGNVSTGGKTGLSDASVDTLPRPDSGPCSDECPAPKAGFTKDCKKRFLYGVNFAWKNFGCDFGGKASWNMKGVAADKTAYTTAIKEMKDHGVNVIRWWMFPDLRGDGIKLDSATSRTPTGLGSTVLDDVEAALAIAAEQNVYIQLTLFSFDNFKPDTADSLNTGPIITDATKRAALINTVVRPIAKAVEKSVNKDRMIAWDVINEPEWAIKSESDPYGDPPFDGQSNLTTVSFVQMETFVKDVVTGLHSESKAPVTVGSAAVKWAKAWSKVGLDYYDFHWYGWVDQYFSHKKTPTDYKVSDLPVVVGEFPLNPSDDKTGQAFGGIGYKQLITDFFDAGYAGTMGWAYSDAVGAFSWANAKTNVKAWADEHPCYTHF